MKQLYLYIGKTVVGISLIAALLVFGLVTLFTLVGELSEVGHGGYNLLQAVEYVLLTTPIQFYQLFPMVGLVGGLLGLGLLSSRSELTVMRASGFSISQITLGVMGAALLLVLLVTFVGEGYGPVALQKATDYKNLLVQKTTKTKQQQATLTNVGVWVMDHNNIIHIAKVLPHRALQGITRYQFNNQKQLVNQSYSKIALYRSNQWILVDVTTSVFANNTVKTTHQNTMIADFSIYPNLFNVAQLPPEAMSLIRLYQYIQFEKIHGMPIVTYQYSFWQRVLQPLSTAVMMLLAVPFVFGSLRSVTMGLRVVLGIVMGGAFYLLNKFLGPVSLVYQVPPFVAAILPTLLFSILGVYLIRWVK